MNSDSNALSERVISSFEKLSSAAKNLNNVSDELGQAITAIDYILQRLNLGVPTWVKFTAAKTNTAWSIGVVMLGIQRLVAGGVSRSCTRKGDYNSPDEESI